MRYGGLKSKPLMLNPSQVPKEVIDCHEARHQFYIFWIAVVYADRGCFSHLSHGQEILEIIQFSQGRGNLIQNNSMTKY